MSFHLTGNRHLSSALAQKPHTVSDTKRSFSTAPPPPQSDMSSVPAVSFPAQPCNHLNIPTQAARPRPSRRRLAPASPTLRACGPDRSLLTAQLHWLWFQPATSFLSPQMGLRKLPRPGTLHLSRSAAFLTAPPSSPAELSQARH